MNDKSIDELFATMDFGGKATSQPAERAPASSPAPADEIERLRAELVREVTATIDRVLSGYLNPSPSSTKSVPLDGLDIDLSGIG